MALTLAIRDGFLLQAPVTLGLWAGSGCWSSCAHGWQGWGVPKCRYISTPTFSPITWYPSGAYPSLASRIPRGNKPELPTVSPCLSGYLLLTLPLCPAPTLPWVPPGKNWLLNQLLALKSLSQGLLLGEPNPPKIRSFCLTELVLSQGCRGFSYRTVKQVLE